MNDSLMILIVEALAVYTLVLGTHALRRCCGLAFFHALMGGLTAVMSWVTDAGMKIQAGGLTFNVGSTVFYTSLLLGVFVIYVFDGPRATRILIATIIGVSVLMPVIALVLHFQDSLLGGQTLRQVPMPDLRTNSASVFTTLVDLVFLAVVWEVLGKPAFQMKLWGRTFLSLLGVMVLDVVLFSTLAFAGGEAYAGILKGTLVSRLFVSFAAFPILYLYIHWQSQRPGVTLQDRPVLAILTQIADISAELTSAQQEIERRKEAENALQKALSEVRTLRGFLPICSHCKRVRDDDGYWQQIELYLREHSNAEFSHGICPECLKQYYPDLAGGDSQHGK